MSKYLLVSPRNYPIENYLNYFQDLVEVKIIPESLKEIDPKKYKGLILIGGEDVNPKHYNEKNLFENLNEINDERDLAEFELIEKFLNYERIIFGICRGIQVLNVFFKGTLYQDIPSELNLYTHKFYKDKTPRNVEVYNNDTYHKIKIINRNPIFENSEFIVNSRHHQAIKKVSDDFYIFATSEDGIIEGIFHKKLLIFGVQWHPERIKQEYNFSSIKILEFLKNDRF
ncbi:MAG: gamma-glutamyl-gamma-aminobutyrate hydrolase family protein [candidate division WOR-3 bacterium]